MMQRSNQRDKAYRQLRAVLLRGGLAAGSRLGETEWSQSLQIHRGALREAFVLLAHEGLLRPGDRGGYFVPVVTRDDRDEILELRLSLELGALRRLSERGGTVCTDALAAMCNAMRQMAELDMPLGFAEADRRFHEELVELAGNRQMIRAYRQSPLLIVFGDQLDASERRTVMERTLSEHEKLCELLTSGRFSDAAELLEQHLSSYRDTLALNHTPAA